MTHITNLDTPLKRALYNSPLKSTRIRILIGVVAIILVAWAAENFLEYYFEAPLQMVSGIALGALVYSPTLLVLAFMMRRKRVPGLFVWAVPVSVITFFGMLTSRTNGFFRSLDIPEYLFAGLSEESWKIVPLLLIIIFARPAITGVRDGILYGALAGFGFSCLEMGSYFALEDYPQTGWTEFFTNSMSRATLLGTDLHIIWSAFFGGAIVWAINSAPLWRRIATIFSAYLLVIVTHSFQDRFGKVLAVLPLAVLEPIFEKWGVTEESMLTILIPLLMYAATVNLLLVSLVLLPLLIWMVLRGGRADREIIAEQLMLESPPVLLAEERPELEAQKRFHRRRIAPDSRVERTIVLAQNELAFRHHQLKLRGDSVLDDPVAASLRAEIKNQRSGSIDLFHQINRV